MVARPELWIESEGEVALLGGYVDLRRFHGINVGKVGQRRDVGDNYLNGTFYIYDVNARGIIPGRTRLAGARITELVQFGMPDIIVADGTTPLVAIELTSHKPTFNNLFQRFPKLYKPSACGIPSYIFQLHEQGSGEDESKILAAADAAQRLTHTPCVVYFYLDEDWDATQVAISQLIDAYLNQDEAWIEDFNEECARRNAPILAEFDIDRFGGRFFERLPDRVIAHIRVKRNCDYVPGIECGINHCQNANEQAQVAREIRARTHLANLNGGVPVNCVWISKGTGGLDPYPGYLLAGKMLLCERPGRPALPLIATFERVPRDFWWWRAAATRLNNRMLAEIADEIRYEGEPA